MYSTTYAAEIVKVVTVIALILDFDVDTHQLEVTIGLVLLIASSLYTLYQRYKAGGVNALGIRR